MVSNRGFVEINQKTDVMIDPTITGEVLLVVVNSDIDHSFILFVSGLIIDICEIPH